MPAVSVVIPAYNSARYLREAVSSVLGQTLEYDLEVIVVDDGSTDDTAAVMLGFDPQVRYLHQPNSGVSVARNRGIAESAGRFIAFLDADDTWQPDKLRKQLDALRAAPGQRLCYSAFLVGDSDLKPIEERREGLQGTALETLLLCGNVVGGGSTVLCERELFTEAGEFDPALSQCADWDMWVRIAAVTEFTYLNEPLVNYRRHETSMSNDPRLLEQDSLSVLEKGFAMPGIDPALAARRQEALARNYMVLAGSYFQAGRYGDFVRCARQAVKRDPRRIGYLAGFPVRVAKRVADRGRR